MVASTPTHGRCSALHRNKFHTLVGAAQTSPFVTLAYLRLFQPGLDDVIFGAEREDAEPAFSWVWWLVCPARIVWRYLAPFWDTNWVLVLGIFMPVMVHQVRVCVCVLHASQPASPVRPPPRASAPDTLDRRPTQRFARHHHHAAAAAAGLGCCR